MKLTNGADIIILTDEMQIRAYLSSGYTEVKETPAKKGGKKGAGKA